MKLESPGRCSGEGVLVRVGMQAEQYDSVLCLHLYWSSC